MFSLFSSPVFFSQFFATSFSDFFCPPAILSKSPSERLCSLHSSSASCSWQSSVALAGLSRVFSSLQKLSNIDRHPWSVVLPAPLTIALARKILICTGQCLGVCRPALGCLGWLCPVRCVTAREDASHSCQ